MPQYLYTLKKDMQKKPRPKIGFDLGPECLRVKRATTKRVCKPVNRFTGLPINFCVQRNWFWIFVLIRYTSLPIIGKFIIPKYTETSILRLVN